MKLKQKIYNYTAIFEPDMERGGYVVKVPALPGCVTQGDNLDDAQMNAREAIELYVEYMKDAKKQIPIEHRGRVIIDIPVAV
ncbi:MAG: hypothetical protein COV10_04785 [Candidatus Vogelbacteria bacterium CG10_big_fil_rev_8_21_14_0_10_51_16]|uniref:HicB-like antitoxin of toxin-antitoxin system domain-containing protein n=1 Tax=Candidatus Vogelbacteria bacterium CG10_big_fil_rev_8_21_14_0_10_51_16 TaxID=1975045 RepID=A0A2H0RF46_9BACT|nr:MAG: hypothetical protein COV10_04785 [Candidatus Vogelbacteria bacterium CG10_big_fil_rev_8_21_14_0_10_51_16]